MKINVTKADNLEQEEWHGIANVQVENGDLNFETQGGDYTWQFVSGTWVAFAVEVDD